MKTSNLLIFVFTLAFSTSVAALNAKTIETGLHTAAQTLAHNPCAKTSVRFVVQPVDAGASLGDTFASIATHTLVIVQESLTITKNSVNAGFELVIDAISSEVAVL